MSSVLTGKLEADVEIKASAEKFHDMFCNKPHHVSNTCSEKVQGCELHDGDWGTEGSIICWSYVHGNITNQEIFYAFGWIYLFFLLCFLHLLLNYMPRPSSNHVSLKIRQPSDHKPYPVPYVSPPLQLVFSPLGS